MKLRIGGLMLVLFLLALSITASGGGLNGALVSEAFTPAAAVPVPPPYAPQVVARVTKKGQTGNIPNTTIFTTGSDGLFRVSAYMVATAASQGDELFLNVSYSDDVAPTNQSFVEALNGVGCSGTQGGCTWVSTMRVVAGSPISYSVVPTGGQVTYDVFFTIERLQ